MICEGFRKCGISFGDFSVNQCHSDLRTILTGDKFDENAVNSLFYSDTSHVFLQDWNLDVSYSFFSLFSNLTKKSKNDIKDDIKKGLSEQLNELGIVDEDYIKDIIDGVELPYLNELYTASKLFNLKITFYEIETLPIVFGEGERSVDVLYFNKLYFMK